MSFTVTATGGGGADGGIELTVRVYTGAVESGGTSVQNGTNSSSAADSSVTPNFSNSLIIYAAYDGTGSGTAFTYVSNMTTYFNGLEGTQPYAHGYYSGTVTASTPVTVGATSNSGEDLMWGIYEIKPSGGSTPALDGSSPTFAGSSTATTITTAAFNPPAGSVLAVMVTMDGNGGTTPTATITDTSGLGLTWTKRASFSELNAGLAAIYTTTIPSASSAPAYMVPLIIPPGRKSPQAFRFSPQPPAQQAAAPPTPVTLQESAAASDDGNLTVSAAVPLGDSAGASDSLTVAVTLAVSDSAAASDDGSPTVTAAVPLAESAAASDAITIPSEGIPLTDSAAANDALSVTVTLSLSDSGADSDALAVSAAVPFSDSGAANESMASGQPTSVGDSAAASDSIAVTVSVPISDSAAASDAVLPAASVPLADSAGASDAIAPNATVPLADSAGANDALATVQIVPVSVADSAAANDMLTVAVAVPFSDTAAASDTVGATATVPLTDSAAASELVAAGVTLTLADSAAAADTVSAQQFSGHTGTVYWWAGPDKPRWRAEPESTRWQAAAVASRWKAEPGEARWTAVPAEPRWRVLMSVFHPIAAISLEYVNVRWASDLDGTEIDPTGQTQGQSLLPVLFAFPVSSGNPQYPAEPVSWFTGDWLQGGTGKGYVAQCAVGPGGGLVTLTAGQNYDVWCEITGTPEAPRKFAGTLPVY